METEKQINNQREKWQPCPRCGSHKVEKSSPLSYILGGIALAGCGIWLLIIPFIGVPLIIIGLLSLILSPLGFINTLSCKDCKKVWLYKE